MPPAAATEAETHYVDPRGRQRKRKRLRTRALASGEMGGSQRRWTPTERELVVSQHNKLAARAVNKQVAYPQVVAELHRLHPTIFGPGSPGKPQGIDRQDVRGIVLRHQKGEIGDGRGRPTTLPHFVVVMMIAAMASVVKARATIVSAPLLHPIAIGVIIAAGYASLLNASRRESLEGRKLGGVFCCALNTIHRIIKKEGWRCVKPQSDTRKVPENWKELRWMLVLRLAYFIFVHEVGIAPCSPKPAPRHPQPLTPLHSSPPPPPPSTAFLIQTPPLHDPDSTRSCHQC